MIDSRILHDKFVTESQRINVDSNITIDTKSIDYYLNKALSLFSLELSQVAHANKEANLYIKELEVPNESMDIDDTYSDYSVFCKYPEELIWPINYRVVSSKLNKKEEKCTSDILIYPVQKNEIPALRENSHMKPSFNWRTSIYAKAGNGIEIVTNKDFDVEKVFLNYYKKHPLIATPKLASNNYYIGQDGKEVRKNQDLLLSTKGVDDMIVQLAILYVSGDINDMQTFNTKKDEILNGLNYVKIKLL